MKKALIFFGIVAVTCVTLRLACFKTEIIENEVGVKYDAAGEVVERVIEVIIDRSMYCVLTPEGPRWMGTSHRYNYFIEKMGKRTPLASSYCNPLRSWYAFKSIVMGKMVKSREKERGWG
jgi:hypothetical protein